jgi:hypothetical protein
LAYGDSVAVADNAADVAETADASGADAATDIGDRACDAADSRSAAADVDVAGDLAVLDIGMIRIAATAAAEDGADV